MNLISLLSLIPVKHCLFVLYVRTSTPEAILTLIGELSIETYAYFLFTTQSDLVKVQESLLYERTAVMVSNVAAVVMAPEEIPDSGEDALIQTLEDKYDALRDKLIAEALLNQVSLGG